MPNASEINPADLRHNIILLGYTGSGKTSQILTLPGKTFAYLFDPSALHTLAGHDIEYEMFVPSKLNIAAQSLSKGRSDQKVKRLDAHEVYTRFVTDLTEKVEQDFFANFDNVVLDSLTTFSDVVMDRVQHLNDREGQQPQQDDWSAQMVTIKSVIRELTGQNVRLVCTGHVEFKQDEDSGKMLNTIRLTGQLRTTLPLLFSDILVCETKENRTKESTEYLVRTQKDRYNPQVRCTLRDEEGKPLKPTVDVTIPPELWKDPRGKCGLGKLIVQAK